MDENIQTLVVAPSPPIMRKLSRPLLPADSDPFAPFVRYVKPTDVIENVVHDEKENDDDHDETTVVPTHPNSTQSHDDFTPSSAM